MYAELIREYNANLSARDFAAEHEDYAQAARLDAKMCGMVAAMHALNLRPIWETEDAGDGGIKMIGCKQGKEWTLVIDR